VTERRARRGARRAGRLAAGAALALAPVSLPLPAPAAPLEVCATVEGAPAATSASLVEGMLREMQRGSREGVRQFLATGQALLLHGGKRAEVLRREPERGLVLFRRGPGQLPLWTAERGLQCPGG
jgi:hypothetical protein